MLRQLLNKIPRKFPKSDILDSSGIDLPNNLTNLADATSSNDPFSTQLNVLKLLSSAVFPALEAVEPHLSFKNASNLQKQNLFVAKLDRCCEVSDSPIVKHEILLELVDFASSGFAKFTEPAIAAMCKLCERELFRVFPPKYILPNKNGETDDEEPSFHPAWSHLQLSYDLLLKFISSVDTKVAKKYMDHAFILRLLDLFDSDDPRERDCLKTILHRMYGKFMVHRPFIRKAGCNIIYRFIFETERHNGIAELLEIFGSVVSGFALPLKEEHKLFLYRALIPLHKPKPVGVYHQQLTFCVVQFIDKDPNLASTVIKGLLKYWPVTNSQKELMFISEVEEILEMISPEEFQKIMVPLFRRLACCLNSSHYQVAERAHLLWNNDSIFNLTMQNRQAIVPLVFSALEHNLQHHWNQAVLNSSQNIRKMLCEMDEELVLSCLNKFQEDNSVSTSVAEKRRMTWERLENAACESATCHAQLNPSCVPVAC